MKTVITKKTLALDPSTKATGWSIFEQDELTAHGVITAGSNNLFSRINKIVAELKNIVLKYNPTDVVLEDVIPDDVRHNQNVYKALVYLQGFILNLLNSHKISNYKFYTSSEWRKRCGIKTGSGIRRQSLKPQDIAFVKRMYDLDVEDDEADAICIGYAYTHKPIPVQDAESDIEIIDGFEFK